MYFWPCIPKERVACRCFPQQRSSFTKYSRPAYMYMEKYCKGRQQQNAAQVLEIFH